MSKNEQGLTLMELMVVTLIMALISLAIFSYYSHGGWQSYKVNAKCLLVTQNKLAELRVSDYDSLGNGSQEVSKCQLNWTSEASVSPEYKTVTVSATHGAKSDKLKLSTVVARPL